jgi:hypothetical protein
MVTPDAFLYSGSTRTLPKDLSQLRRIAGYGSSPVVNYDGEGVYFLDRVREGVWRLEVYPDAVPVNDPFEMQRRDKIVTRAIYRSWPMRIKIAELGSSFLVEPVTRGNPSASHATEGQFDVEPGVYVLSAKGAIDRSTLPARMNKLGFAEFHAPKPDSLPPRVLVVAPQQHVIGQPMEISARVVTDVRPDSVYFWLRRTGIGWFRRFQMHPAGAYEYRVTIPADSLADGPHEYVVSVRQGNSKMTFPEGIPRAPWDWDFHTESFWKTIVVHADAPLKLIAPAEDASRLAFTRIGDAIRQGIFRVVTSSVSGEAALHMELPVNVGGFNPEDYTASLVIRDRILSRGAAISDARAVRLTMRGVGPSQRLHVTLMEKDGTSWTAIVNADSTWRDYSIPLSEFRIARGVKLPLGYPGQWNYWVDPASGRGASGDSPKIADVERLQLSLRRAEGQKIAPGTYGVEVESVALLFRKE